MFALTWPLLSLCSVPNLFISAFGIQGETKKRDTFAHLYLQSKYFKSNKRHCILTHSYSGCSARECLREVRKGLAGYRFAEANVSAKISLSELITCTEKHVRAPVLFRLLWSAPHAQTCAQRICAEGSNGRCQHVFLLVNEIQGHS